MLGIFLCHLTHVLTGFHIIDYKVFPTDFPYGLECFVVLFFILSGFKLAASISFSRETGHFSYPRYLLRRFLSIWPLAMIALISYAIFRFYLRKAEWDSLGVWDYLEHVFLLNGLDPKASSGTVLPGGWFIGALWIYYLFAPLLVAVANDSEKSLWVVGFAFLIRYLFTFTLGSPWFGVEAPVWADYVKHAFFSCLPFFAMGILGYHLFIQKDLRLRPSALIPLLGLLVYFGSLDDLWGRLSLLFFASLGTASLLNRERINQLRVLPVLAKGALGCYLLQMLFLRTAAMFYPYAESLDDWGKWWLTLFLIFPGLVLLSVGLFYGVERPLLLFSRSHSKEKAAD